MKYLLIVLYLALYSHAMAQEYYLVNKDNNDTTFVKRSITLEIPRMKASYFLLDGKEKIPAKDIGTYQNKEGYFRRVYDDGFFVMRIADGKYVDEFSTETTKYTSTYAPGPGGGGGFHSKATVHYYSMNNGKIKELKYGYLKEDLRGNVQSLQHLNKVKKQNFRKAMWYTVGAGMLVYGLSKSKFDNVSSGTSNDNEKGHISPFVFGSFIPFAIPAFDANKRQKHLKAAISAFNQ